MDISTLGSIGEIVGSIAVVITIVYLALQTAENRRAIRQQSHSDILSRRQELFKYLIDPEFIGVWSQGLIGEPMTGVNAQRFTTYTVNFLSHVQDTFLQNKSNLIDDEVWEAEARICSTLFTQPGFLDWWQHGQQFLTPEFSRVIENFPKSNLVLYDAKNARWIRPDEGRFGKDGEQAIKNEQ